MTLKPNSRVRSLVPEFSLGLPVKFSLGITEEHIAEARHNLLGEQYLDEWFRNIVESFVHFRYFLFNTSHLPERSLDRELYHIMEENCNVFGFIDLNPRDIRGQTTPTRKNDDGDAHLDNGKVDSPIELDGRPKEGDFKHKTEVG